MRFSVKSDVGSLSAYVMANPIKGIFVEFYICLFHSNLSTFTLQVL